MLKTIAVLLALHALPLALLASTAHGADMNVYELRVELNGQVYAADTGLSGDDCLMIIDNISEIEISDGVFQDVPKDAPVYCVSM